MLWQLLLGCLLAYTDQPPIWKYCGRSLLLSSAEVFLPAYMHTVVDRGQCAATGAAHGLLQAKP